MKTQSEKIRIVLTMVAMAMLAVLLTGCGATKEIVVTKVEYRVVKTPEHLLQPCASTKPPAKPSVYAKLSADEKEKLTTEYIVELHGDISRCNNSISSIKDFQEKEVKNIEGKNK